ncbi:MAG: DUF4907 domain-containing protein [Bacteroidetes bacterium]|nr:DUF4907 domain-containing protein [Bacteroidota bacterium]
MDKFTSYQKGLIILFVIFTVYGCSAERKNTSASNSSLQEQTKPPSRVEKYIFSIIPAAENTFGYEISEQGKVLVRQKTIPSLPGNSGFNTKGDAEKCARLVISKLSKNIMPPTVTPKEIDSLGIRTKPDNPQKNH